MNGSGGSKKKPYDTPQPLLALKGATETSSHAGDASTAFSPVLSQDNYGRLWLLKGPGQI